MRLWSLHPQYLDSKGLVALWREALLAQNVLRGNTKGYKNHPQLARFKIQEKPVDAIGKYLFFVWQEAERRGYNFAADKIIAQDFPENFISVTTGQLVFELSHLRNKLAQRDPARLLLVESLKVPEIHSIFRSIDGDIEDWEIV